VPFTADRGTRFLARDAHDAGEGGQQRQEFHNGSFVPF
jgi:hypothetical protein